MSAAMDTDNSIGPLLRETAERVFRDHCAAGVVRLAEQGTWPAAAWAALEEAGLHRALLAEAAGGFGVPVTDALSLLRVAAEHALPLPLAETMLAGWLLGKAGLPVPDGPLTVAPVVHGETLTVTRDRLHGVASRIPWGRNAGAVAAVVEFAGRAGVALVQPGGWTTEPGENVAREPRDTLRFDDVPVTVRPIDVSPADVRAVGAALRSQQMAGALMRLTAMTTHYAQDRVQFGRPIGKFQAVQHMIAELAAEAAAAKAGAELALRARDAGADFAAVAAAKIRASLAAGKGAALAHQIHGAIGVTEEHALHDFTRRLWQWRDDAGDEFHWSERLGRLMIQGGGAALWRNIVAIGEA